MQYWQNPMFSELLSWFVFVVLVLAIIGLAYILTTLNLELHALRRAQQTLSHLKLSKETKS